jgi:hypothetical protein
MSVAETGNLISFLLTFEQKKFRISPARGMHGPRTVASFCTGALQERNMSSHMFYHRHVTGFPFECVETSWNLAVSAWKQLKTAERGFPAAGNSQASANLAASLKRPVSAKTVQEIIAAAAMFRHPRRPDRGTASTMRIRRVAFRFWRSDIYPLSASGRANPPRRWHWDAQIFRGKSAGTNVVAFLVGQ